MIRLHLTNREKNYDKVNEQVLYIYNVGLVFREGIKMRFVTVFVFSKEKSPYSNAQRAAGVCQ